ncbi:type II secretion system F family protein [Corynebacterium pseudotuberculosis]|uniref:type II secretion system F family protein n=1 Tax=Corynebacterium pseudotuberculosis TaxID=1719 RepID=UPI002ADE13EA|nr:type II secretion system F family protein [Corynebacterium pseudotuberculosis]MEA1025988.1 type II secretion system F family protein [Corynebacterium pseudotuberculosis]
MITVIAMALIALAASIKRPDVVQRIYRARDGPQKIPCGVQRYWDALLHKLFADRLSSDFLRKSAYQLDLFAACVQSGLTPSQSAFAVAATEESSPRDARVRSGWLEVAMMLEMGMPAECAWQSLAEHPALGDLVTVARASERSGATLAEACERLARQLRARASDLSLARAERAGVLIALPLTVCFLPAFFLLGLAPVVISLGIGIFS